MNLPIENIDIKRLKNYAYFVLTNPAFSYVKKLYSIDDAISDAFLLRSQQPEVLWKKLIWKAVANFRYSYIKSSPKRYIAWREYQKKYKREARENIDDTYIKDQLRLSGTKLTGKNISNKRNEILAFRISGFRKPRGTIPAHPKNSILLKDLNGYKEFVGYAISNDRAKFYSCKGRGGKITFWKELKVNKRCVIVYDSGKLTRLKLSDL